MNTGEAKKIAGLIVKVSNELEACHPKHLKKRARLLRQGIMLSERLDEVIGTARPLSTDKEVEMIGYQMVEWMSMRIRERLGRIVQLPVLRIERRYRQRTKNILIKGV